MDATTAVVAVTAVSVIFVALQARYTRQQRVLNGVQLLGQLTRMWETLRPDWQLAVLLGRGVDDYYVDTPPSEVQEFRAFQRTERLLERLESAASRLGPRAWHVVYEFNRSRTHYRRRHYEFRVRRVLVFLSTVGDLVVDGSLSPALAYGVLGTDLIRSGGALDSLMRAESPDDPVGRGYARHWAGWLDYYPGVERRLLVLPDVLWAEAVCRGDLTDDEAEAVAQHKAMHGTGRVCRDRAGRLARKSGGALISLRLRRLLRWAEVPPGGGGLGRRIARLPGVSRLRPLGASRRGRVRVRLPTTREPSAAAASATPRRDQPAEPRLITPAVGRRDRRR